MNHCVFISTALPYVNAPPHLGFALEVVLADAIARHARARSKEVRFVSGTDDHSSKNVRAAERAGVSTRAYVDAAAGRYLALARVAGAAYDDFVRTSADPRHAAAVEALWEACRHAGDLEKRGYRGLYCAGCERFLEAGEVEVCPEHGTKAEVVEEENWFFALSRYADRIRAALESGALRIHPPERANEVLRFLDTGLHDVSVSRPGGRTRGWGIPVPGDPDQTVYVWFDALASYVVSRDAWHGAERRIHVIGKGIARFHAVLWPALLLAAGLPLPTDLVVHGYVTVDGKKIGKSLGNAIDPGELAERFGTDALRYYLLRHVGAVNDADVSVERIATAYSSELADGLGNLLARTLGLVRARLGGERPTPEPGVDASSDALAARAEALQGEVDRALEGFAVDDALRAVFAVVAEANVHLARTAPWSADDGLRGASLGATCVALEAIARALGPLLPTTANRIAQALAAPAEPSPILFPKE
ncbi:MAG: methionine--tRNA ligase [Labilithrix sp.]